MERSRRSFLKIAGLSVLGLGSLPLVRAIAQDAGASIKPDPGALEGKKWGMVVETAKCKEGCVDCINACHFAHNVPDIPDKTEEIKWIWHETYEHSFTEQQHDQVPKGVERRPFMMMCNHCTKPPCVRVCPTKATFKREDGIVFMDFHRCIGCRYCMAGCPYGSRSFNWSDPRPHIKKINQKFPTRVRGVVEKCNFCAERLAVGQLPACVVACKEKCLAFGDLEDPHSDASRVLEKQYAIVRKAALGTGPNVYYIL